MRYLIKIYLVVFLFSSVAALSAQVNADSLLGVWNDAGQADTIRLKAVQAVIWGGLINRYPDSVFRLASGQLDFARQKRERRWEAKALYNMATFYYGKGNYSQSFEYFRQSLDIRKETSDLKGEAAIYGNFGLIYNQQGNNLKALDYQLKSLEINARIKDTAGITTNYNNLAMIYQDQFNSKKALEYYEKALKLFHPVKNKRDIGLTYNNIASVCTSNDMYTTALEYLQKSLAIRTEMNDYLGMAINYVNLGSNYSKLARYDTAMMYVSKGARLFESLGDKAGSSNAWYFLGDISYLQKKYSEAVVWCGKSLKAAMEIDKLPIARVACTCLYETYKAMGNSEKALYYHEKFKVFSDSLKKGETEVKLNQMEFEKEILTDSLVREEEKQLLKIAYQAEINEKTQIRNVILIASIGILFLALVFLSRMFYFQKRSEGLHDKTQQLEKQQLIHEIDLLKTQVNPHFLFNSLSILSSLVRVNPDLSEQFIDQLSRSYRYILDQKDQTLVTLRTELEFIRSYSFLLKIRFVNKFDLQVNLDETVLDQYKIAPLTLQLLIENAVKHNRMSVREPLVVEVFLTSDYLVVKNDLRLRPAGDHSTGTGLNNIINRYALLTDRSVRAGECEDTFVVRVPLL